MPQQTDLFYFGLNNGPNAIAQFSKNDYRSARITLQASSNVEHQLSEVYLIHDNTTAYIRQIDFIYTTDPFIDYTATIDGNNVNLFANSSLANTDIVIFANLFDNPITADDKAVNFDSIVSSAMAVSNMYPSDNTDYAAAMTSSLDKTEDIYLIQMRIDSAIAHMKTAEFNARSTADKNDYINALANAINNTASTLSSSVQADVQAFYDVSKKIEAASALTNINVGVSNPNVKVLMDKVLNANGKSLFQ